MTVFEAQVITWGVKADDKYSGYKVPIALSDKPDIVEAIEKLAADNGVPAPLYKKYKTLYLKVKALSQKQTKELLDKKRQDIKIKFEFTGMSKESEKTGKRYMNFKVLGLGKIERTEEVVEDL